MKGMRNIWGILLLLITLTATAHKRFSDKDAGVGHRALTKDRCFAPHRRESLVVISIWVNVIS